MLRKICGFLCGYLGKWGRHICMYVCVYSIHVLASQVALNLHIVTWKTFICKALLVLYKKCYIIIIKLHIEYYVLQS